MINLPGVVRTAVAAAMFVGGVASVSAVALATSAALPTLTVLNEALPDDAISTGETFKVEGTSWPVDTLIQLEVCGNEARSGTSDCAADTGQVVASNASGTFQGRLAVVIPPTPCPCVIRAVSETTSDAVTTPVDIPNAPTSHAGDGDIVAPALRRLEVERVHLRGHDSWNTWLGGPARRTFEFEVVNTGTVAVENATVVLTAGAVDDPNGFLKPVKLERVEVGERRKITVPVEFEALAFGDQAVRATVNGTSVPVSFRSTTSTHPWLLIIVPTLIIGQLMMLGIRNIVRRRLHDDDLDTPVMVGTVDGPADDSLICVVEFTETSVEPLVQHHTAVLRSIAAVKGLVRESLPVDGLTPSRTITAITVLADADAKVGDAHRACDDLCVWIDAAFTDAGVPLSLRRRHATSANAGMGMVPLSVLVRNAHQAA